MATRIPLIGLLLLTGLVLAACGGGTNGPPAQANYAGNQGPQPGDSTILGDAAGLSFGVGKGAKKQDSAGGGALGVNAYLWRGALDTLSFMPLSSADPFGGVIITDWYTPPSANGERFKLTIDYLPGTDDQQKNVAEYLRGQLKKVGIMVEVRASADFPAWAKRLATHDFDMSMDVVFNWGDPVIGVARTHSDAVALAKNKKPGLILADIQLADGSSGLDAVNELLRTFEVPVVFITAYPERFLTGERPEPAFLISKPFQPAMVSAVASQALFFQRNSRNRAPKAASA